MHVLCVDLYASSDTFEVIFSTPLPLTGWLVYAIANSHQRSNTSTALRGRTASTLVTWFACYFGSDTLTIEISRLSTVFHHNLTILISLGKFVHQNDVQLKSYVGENCRFWMWTMPDTHNRHSGRIGRMGKMGRIATQIGLPPWIDTPTPHSSLQKTTLLSKCRNTVLFTMAATQWTHKRINICSQL